MSTYQYDEKEYAALLQMTRRRWEFIFFDKIETPGNVVLWRHDIDFSPHRALRLAGIEQDLDIHSTFFFHLHNPFYSLLEGRIIDIVQAITAMGHRIGLHFDPVYYGSRISSFSDLERYLAVERDSMQAMLDVPVEAFSFHNPTLSPFSETGADLISDMANASGRCIQDNFLYASDSRGGWRRRDLPAIVRAGEVSKLHVLTHPVRWTPTPCSMTEAVMRCVEGRTLAARRIGNTYLDLWNDIATTPDDDAKALASVYGVDPKKNRALARTCPAPGQPLSTPPDVKGRPLRVALFGGTGFVGRVLAHELSARGHDVSIFSRSRGGLDRKFAHVPYDVLAPGAIPGPVDAAYYLAQADAIDARQPGRLFGVNTLGALHAAQAALDAGCRFFCNASSGTVYAPSFAARTEQDPLDRGTPYSLSKIHSEEALSFLAGSMHVVNARLFGVFGPGTAGRLAAVLRQRVRDGKPVQLFPSAWGDDGGLRMSYLYVEDLARCLADIAERQPTQPPLPAVINVAGPDAVTIERFCLTVGRILGKEPVFERMERPRASDYVADITLLSSLLHPVFTPFEEALRRCCLEDA